MKFSKTLITSIKTISFEFNTKISKKRFIYFTNVFEVLNTILITKKIDLPKAYNWLVPVFISSAITLKEVDEDFCIQSLSKLMKIFVSNPFGS